MCDHHHRRMLLEGWARAKSGLPSVSGEAGLEGLPERRPGPAAEQSGGSPWKHAGSAAAVCACLQRGNSQHLVRCEQFGGQGNPDDAGHGDGAAEPGLCAGHTGEAWTSARQIPRQLVGEAQGTRGHGLGQEQGGMGGAHPRKRCPQSNLECVPDSSFCLFLHQSDPSGPKQKRSTPTPWLPGRQPGSPLLCVVAKASPPTSAHLDTVLSPCVSKHRKQLLIKIQHVSNGGALGEILNRESCCPSCCGHTDRDITAALLGFSLLPVYQANTVPKPRTRPSAPGPWADAETTDRGHDEDTAMRTQP